MDQCVDDNEITGHIVMPSDFAAETVVITTDLESDSHEVGYTLGFEQPNPSTEQQEVTYDCLAPGDDTSAYIAVAHQSTCALDLTTKSTCALDLSVKNQSEDEATAAANEIARRERDREFKRQKRKDPHFRNEEKVKSRSRMKTLRQDPAYREQERQKDRERRQLARKNNPNLRQRERVRDKEKKRQARELVKDLNLIYMMSPSPDTLGLNSCDIAVEGARSKTLIWQENKSSDSENELTDDCATSSENFNNISLDVQNSCSNLLNPQFKFKYKSNIQPDTS